MGVGVASGNSVAASLLIRRADCASSAAIRSAENSKTDLIDRATVSPPLDRIDYIDHAVVLLEREHVRPVRPALEEIQHYLSGAPFTNWTDQARRFATAETLDAKDRKAFLRTLLYPGRFCYSWLAGRMGSNDDAAAFLSKTGLSRLDLSLIVGALQCRQANADPDSLFPARTKLPSQIDACTALRVAPTA